MTSGEAPKPIEFIRQGSRGALCATNPHIVVVWKYGIDLELVHALAQRISGSPGQGLLQIVCPECELPAGQARAAFSRLLRQNGGQLRCIVTAFLGRSFRESIALSAALLGPLPADLRLPHAVFAGLDDAIGWQSDHFQAHSERLQELVSEAFTLVLPPSQAASP